MNEELKIELAKIYDFVKVEFNIEDESEVLAIKESLELDKIDTLDKMLKEYKKVLKKAINAEKRKEAQREAQKNFKNVQTNIRIEEYEKYENDAIEKSMSISEYLKNALKAFISPQKDETDKVPEEMNKEVITGRYEALNIEIEALKSDKSDLMKNLNTLKSENTRLETENRNIEDMKKSVSDLEIKNKNLDTALKSEKEKVKKLESLTRLEKFLSIFN